MVKQIARARALLRARELRAVHAVPRRHGVDDEDPRAHRRRRRHDGGSRHAARHRREHDRQDDLRAQRLVRDAGRRRASRSSAASSRRSSRSKTRSHRAGGGGLMADDCHRWSTSRSKDAPVSVPDGTSILEAAKTAGVLDPALLLPPGTSGGRRVPHVPRRSREGAEARAFVRDGGRRRAGRARALGEGARGAQGRARDAAHQPPARLPDLRPVRRVRAAGLHVSRKGARTRATASPSASIRSRISAATCCTSPNRCILCTRCVRFMDDVAHDPVLNVSERGDRALHRQVRGQGPHASVGRQRHRPLPGRRAPLQGLPEQGARVGARPHRVGLPELHAGLQHHRRDARQLGRAPPAAPERGSQPVLHVRPRPAELPLDEPAGSRSRCRSVRRGGGARDGRTGKSRCRGRGALLSGKRVVRARVAEPVERSAVPARAARAEDRAARARSASRTGRKRHCPASTDLALRTERAANVRGAELLGFTRERHAARADCRPVTCSSSPTTSSTGADCGRSSRRPARDRASARRCPRRLARAPTSCCRSQPHRRRRNVHQPARPRAALPAGQGGAWARAAELVRARRPARGVGEEADYFTGVATSSPRSRPRARDVRRAVVRHARAARDCRCCSRRRDGGGGAMTSHVLALVFACSQATTRRRRRRLLAPGSSLTVVKMLVVLHDLHGRRRAARRSPSGRSRRGSRIGTDRTASAWHGLLQPVADGVKNFMKEETYPAHANKPLFILAPVLSFIPALIAWAVIPFGAPWASPWGRIDMVLADLPIGFLFILAISLARRVRHRARRLGVEQQVRAARRPPLERADGLVRDLDGHVDDSRAAARRQRLAAADRERSRRTMHVWNVLDAARSRSSSS